MRLEVFCQKRPGMTRELLDLLTECGIDLCSIEMMPDGRIYLCCSPVNFAVFSQLMTDIRRINGVTDVRTVSVMPSQHELRAMRALLVAMPEPVLSVDVKGVIELTNSAAQQLFSFDETKIRQMNVCALITDFNFSRWLESERIATKIRQVVIKGSAFLMEAHPVYMADEAGRGSVLAGAVIILKSIRRMKYQLQHIDTKDDLSFDRIVAVNPTMHQLIGQARKMAMLDVPLLITGDTGTGKDMLARACHLFSARGQKPFLALNCAALPDDVVESELFGHAAGAYPNALEDKKGFFEQANGGSVLLDEIGEMSARMQTKLLRFINDGTFRRVGEESEVHVDVRVICATQKNLTAMVQRGEFREDLFYRLNVLTLSLPPLRERPQDLLPLTEMFVAQFADEQGIARPGCSVQLTAFLSGYHWPGNIRELKNVIYRALTQLEGGELRPQDICLPDSSPGVSVSDEMLAGSLDDIIGRFERSVLTRLYLSYPSTRKLAKRLSMSHTAIANKLREYGLNHKKRDIE